MKQSVCLFYRDSKKGILGVTRRDNRNDWGLPGGKVDPGESLEEAIVREVFEETGFELNPMYLEKVFESLCGKYIATTFAYTGKLSNPQKVDEKEGVVGWITWKELFNGSFSDYNKLLWSSL